MIEQAGENVAPSERVVKQPDGTMLPAPGWEWCGYCNGEGFVMTMDSGPHLDEHQTECGFCEDGLRRNTRDRS